MTYTLPQLTVYFLLYSFFGWGFETVCIALRQRRFVNRGLLNLPLIPAYGITAALLMMSIYELPNLPLQFLLCFMVSRVVQLLCEELIGALGGGNRDAAAFVLALPKHLRLGVYGLMAAAFQLILLVVQPLLHVGLALLPHTVMSVIAFVGLVLIGMDLCSVLYTLRTGRVSAAAEQRMGRTDRLSERIALSVRDRLNTAYPGIMTPDPSDDGDHTFARGLCFDKLVWVFLVSSFLGACIEMCYCYAIDGYWMNRSSLLYGAFSVVWGAGAVILTVALQAVADKADRHVFLAGFFIGGAYEYLCSVFTEVVFGQVFWDYSNMPLNIGGRTNVVYCIFWGILAVVWVKVLYPKLSDWIQRIPAIPGKLVTWVLVVVMGCNCALTAAAMVRYDLRQTDSTASNWVEEYLDTQYDDDWMEHRWPNMKKSE